MGRTLPGSTTRYNAPGSMIIHNVETHERLTSLKERDIFDPQAMVWFSVFVEDSTTYGLNFNFDVLMEGS